MLLPGLTGQLWPVHPHPLPDELLSSWMLRLARGNNLKLQTFSRLVFGRSANIWTRDIDVSASDHILKALCECTGATQQEAYDSTLRAYAGTFVEKVCSNRQSRWILPWGIYHRKRRRCGLQFCPLCLQTDSDPYFRRSWRLAFFTECPIHHVILWDCCPNCHEPVTIHRGEMGRRRLIQAESIRECSSCGFDLAWAPKIRHPWLDWTTCVNQGSLMMFHWLPKPPVISAAKTSADLFLGWHLLANLTISHRVVGSRLAPSLYSIFPDLAEVRRRKSRTIEQLPTKERMIALEAALWLMLDWPQRFAMQLKDARLTKRWIWHATPSWPAWVANELYETNSG